MCIIPYNHLWTTGIKTAYLTSKEHQLDFEGIYIYLLTKWSSLSDILLLGTTPGTLSQRQLSFPGLDEQRVVLKYKFRTNIISFQVYIPWRSYLESGGQNELLQLNNSHLNKIHYQILRSCLCETPLTHCICWQPPFLLNIPGGPNKVVFFCWIVLTMCAQLI